MSATTTTAAGAGDALVTTPDAAPISAPLRNLALTLLLTISSLALVGLVWGGRGYEMLIVAMGWPHVILGFLFYFGKVTRGDEGARLAFLLLIAATLSWWTLHYFFALNALIYLYFLYHAFRDEITIYLQTRARHRGGNLNLYVLSGITPLILLMLVIPQPADFRHDLRRAELTGSRFAHDAPTLIRFQPIPNSGGRDFYFFLQAPDTENLRAFVATASRADVRPDGEIRVGDEPWKEGADLRFAPYYEGDPGTPTLADFETPGDPNSLPVLLTGGHRVGQTFRAARDNLAGIWLPIRRFEDEGENTRFVFRLASPPLLPLGPHGAQIRTALIVLLSLLIVWRLLPQLRRERELWIYLAAFSLLFAGLQYGLKLSTRASYDVPMIFQFVVVFHYWSWYVFSLNKIRARPAATAIPPSSNGVYQRLLGRLRHLPQFLVTMIALNAISALAAFWYYGAPQTRSAARFLLDYNYFLYFLVLHVTFSFAPKLNFRPSMWRARAAS